MMWTGRQVERITGGRLLAGADRRCTGVSTDTRSLSPGDLFVPIVGERFDGHNFIDRALERQCCGSLVAKDRELDLAGRLHVEVPDTLVALGDLARAHLESLSVQVVGITGSNGKTSTKELVATALSAHGSVTRNPGNFNNLVGLPLSAFEVTEEHDFAVLEMGMNAPGEIARLTEIAQPDVGVITGVAAAHLEGLGSIEGVAAAKAELFDGLSAASVAVVNERDPHVRERAKGIAATKIRVGTGTADVAVASIQRLGVAGLRATVSICGQKYEMSLRALGEHSIWNAAMAMGVVLALDLDPAPALAALHRHGGVAGRLQWKVGADGVNVIDDTYNANPESTRAALMTLVGVPGQGRRIAVLGDMLELGPDAPALHEEVGSFAAGLELDYLFACGAHRDSILAGFEGKPAQVFQAIDAAELIEPLKSLAREDDWILVKGSRGMRMERVVANLVEDLAS